ncbi:uncharacterized protein Z518_04656 [Rhinocladiella mackenziei CBS 650.93]|uniref:DUF7703 domain-containing protein n=1 Tax=Rhinocladiella mackenziei CBS 650.93 TaxID=1442369 RepID=A0A0D2JC57_9EURO|nr:uncharacterized protein Z518_04656 [Rhinocladiella mackenziei CBS 650.93]KIX06680.1 hypothetical protein Z518_04656 [Rhinocladiella mackenziei CBS 650.93]
MSSNSAASASSPSSAGEGITGGYEGKSLALKVMIAFFLGLAMYNVVELQILIFGTFNKFRGLYFWSLVISSLGIIPYAIGFILKYFSVLTGGGKWFSVFLLSIGWYPMVTGQAIVLWSRLHLIVTGEKGDRILKWTKWMIIIDAIVLHIPTTVLTVGSNSDINTDTFVRGYNVMEKVQMCGFFLQEVILSSIYIVETVRILRSSAQENTKRLMYQLMAINVLIIIMDLGLLGLECASLYILETTTKPVFYSIKLKLEFAILGKLVQFVGGRQQSGRQQSIPFSDGEKQNSSGLDRADQYDISDFVDLTKVRTDVTRTSQLYSKSISKRADGQDLSLDYEIARLEHVETLPSQARVPNGDTAPPRQRKLDSLQWNFEDI